MIRTVRNTSTFAERVRRFSFERKKKLEAIALAVANNNKIDAKAGAGHQISTQEGGEGGAGGEGGEGVDEHDVGGGGNRGENKGDRERAQSDDPLLSAPIAANKKVSKKPAPSPHHGNGLGVVSHVHL